jgi:hypothetical protein
MKTIRSIIEEKLGSFGPDTESTDLVIDQFLCDILEKLIKTHYKISHIQKSEHQIEVSSSILDIKLKILQLLENNGGPRTNGRRWSPRNGQWVPPCGTGDGWPIR